MFSSSKHNNRLYHGTGNAVQVGAYYNFEEVIDSDEELDLQSMDNGSSLDAVASTTVD